MIDMLSRKKVLLLVTLVVILFLVYVGYYELTKREEWTLEVYFNDKKVKEFSISWLKERCDEVKVNSFVYKGVSLEIILRACKIESVKSFVAVGADGYHREINGTYVSFAYVAVIPKEDVSSQGPLRLIVVGLSKKYWVKFLVRIEVKG